MNGHVGCQEGLLEEVMFRQRRVGPAVVMEAETGGKAMRAEGVARGKAMKLESEQTLWTERQEVGRSQARASRRSPGAFCILCILGVPSSLPEGRRGPPTQNARIVAAGSQAMKRPDLEGRLVKLGGGGIVLHSLLRNSRSLCQSLQGVCLSLRGPPGLGQRPP